MEGGSGGGGGGWREGRGGRVVVVKGVCLGVVVESVEEYGGGVGGW